MTFELSTSEEEGLFSAASGSDTWSLERQLGDTWNGIRSLSLCRVPSREYLDRTSIEMSNGWHPTVSGMEDSEIENDRPGSVHVSPRFSRVRSFVTPLVSILSFVALEGTISVNCPAYPTTEISLRSMSAP